MRLPKNANGAVIIAPAVDILSPTALNGIITKSTSAPPTAPTNLKTPTIKSQPSFNVAPTPSITPPINLIGNIAIDTAVLNIPNTVLTPDTKLLIPSQIPGNASIAMPTYSAKVSRILGNFLPNCSPKLIPAPDISSNTPPTKPNFPIAILIESITVFFILLKVSLNPLPPSVILPNPCKKPVFMPSNEPVICFIIFASVLVPFCTPSMDKSGPRSFNFLADASNCIIALAILAACALPALSSIKILSFSALLRLPN